MGASRSEFPDAIGRSGFTHYTKMRRPLFPVAARRRPIFRKCICSVSGAPIGVSSHALYDTIIRDGLFSLCFRPLLNGAALWHILIWGGLFLGGMYGTAQALGVHLGCMRYIYKGVSDSLVIILIWCGSFSEALWSTQTLGNALWSVCDTNDSPIICSPYKTSYVKTPSIAHRKKHTHKLNIYM